MMPHTSRLQITVYNRLVAEFIGPYQYVYDMGIKWCQRRYARGQSMGASVQCRADLPRTWPVAVGACCTCGERGPCDHDVTVALGPRETVTA